MDMEKINLNSLNLGKCLSLIGMPGAGKTTLGQELGHLLKWKHLDTDKIMESIKGVSLEKIVRNLNKEEFLKFEAFTIQNINLEKVIISTGGSAVYGQKTMDYLKSQGPVVYLELPWEIINLRVSKRPNRGLAKEPGQSLRALYEERKKLYEQAASFRFIPKVGESPKMQAFSLLKNLFVIN